MEFFVYILESVDSGKYYIGHTNDIENRLKDHNRGKNMDAYTYKYRPWKLVYKELFQTRKEAIKRERQLKSWKSRVAISKVIMGA